MDLLYISLSCQAYPLIAGQVRTKLQQGWYFTGGSTRANALASQPPTYATQAVTRPNAKL